MARFAEAARRILAADAAGGGSSSEVAAATARACDRMARHLAPILGEAGVRALYDRALTLTRAEHAWFAEAGTAPLGGPWTQLQGCLAKQAPEAAASAAAALLAGVLELLGRLIGDGLTARLLHGVWPEVFPAGPPKETS